MGGRNALAMSARGAIRRRGMQMRPRHAQARLSAALLTGSTANNEYVARLEAAVRESSSARRLTSSEAGLAIRARLAAAIESGTLVTVNA
ncbi:hypothetical protein ACFL31_03945 [Candidatus Margulisiibacteriota bacterium]